MYNYFRFDFFLIHSFSNSLISHLNVNQKRKLVLVNFLLLISIISLIRIIASGSEWINFHSFHRQDQDSSWHKHRIVSVNSHSWFLRPWTLALHTIRARKQYSQTHIPTPWLYRFHNTWSRWCNKAFSKNWRMCMKTSRHNLNCGYYPVLQRYLQNQPVKQKIIIKHHTFLPYQFW